ncbi:hypothetical protein [Saccharothrix algeriensis]|uniref:Secreted protein n=1 Tax=Saccharothrix algeriensis TaxID=173560 RepID=A0A8T8I1U5_9PSEU|nr:hypothetical protein [Saccharothrix algeriensis]MBM7810668.1 hypothetical protein [Saccharothrix algeriensis]QTR04746.1 hypothetical protein J7S33_07975 [Saccharothrix algeriensis]
MRSTGTAIGAGALLLVVLAGCASSQPSQDAGSGGGPTLTTAPSEPPPSTGPESESPVPPGGTEVPPAKLDATAVPEGMPRTVWTEGDGRKVGLIGQEGGCGKASVEIAGQGPQTVELVVVETVPADAQVCTMDIRYPPLAVELDAPLGDRTVVLSTRQDQK